MSASLLAFWVAATEPLLGRRLAKKLDRGGGHPLPPTGHPRGMAQDTAMPPLGVAGWL